MNIVPKYKTDIVSCENLALASDDEVKKNLPELLEWLQDCNWPVAPLVIHRIKDLDSSLIDPLKSILNGNDGVWKYSIIINLLNKIRFEVLTELESGIKNLILNSSENDIYEEVNLIAQELLDEQF
jgi:hypothetical protein